jgi:undecaprenyl-diphosphatase
MTSRARGALRGLLEQPEVRLLGAVLLAVVAALGFIALGDEVAEGDLGGFDRWALRAARLHVVRSSDSAMAEIAKNITALGGYPVLVLLLCCVIGFLLLHRMPGRALYVLAATSGGALLSQWLKTSFTRPRPSVVEPLVMVSSWSFPSGHALSSAVVYLTLGSLVAATVERRVAKLYVLFVAFALTGLIGVSRILLGVHYPTDVLAGWLAGLAWALGCWSIFELWQLRRARRMARAR